MNDVDHIHNYYFITKTSFPLIIFDILFIFHEHYISYSIIENRMSKNKGKDKKNDNSSLIQKQFEAQKRDIIEYQFTIKKLQQKLADKTLQNEQLNKQLEQIRIHDKQTIQFLKSKQKSDQQQLEAQLTKNSELDYECVRIDAQKRSLEQMLHQERISRQTQVEALRFRAENQPKMLMKQIEDLKLLDRHKYEQEILNLKDLIEYEKAEKTRQLADKQRQKVQATDKLRDEMLKKIRQMRTNLLSLKKEQLSTTTRLTILQNHQLTSELQYQSKQTQKLIFKEQEMNQKIKQLTQQLAIHKQVEQQLAKRAHFSKGVIKKLNERIADLEKRLENSKNSRNFEEGGRNTSHNHTSGVKSKIFIQTPDQSGKQILAEVEKQLSATEKKYSEIQSKLQATEKQRDSLQGQIRRYQSSCNQLAKVLIAYSQQILAKPIQDKPESDMIDSVLKIDLEQLRNKKVEDWSHDQTTLVVKIMLNLIKPYLNKRNIMIPAIRRLLVLQDSKNDRMQAKLPKIIIEGNENSSKGLKDLPTNIASKIVSSNLRQWGQTVNFSSNPLLKKKYKISQSHR